MEKTNARFITGFDEIPRLVTIDASFISLRTLLPVIYTWFLGEIGSVIALIKPQFEAGRKETAKGEGVIRDPLVHRKVLEEVLIFSAQTGFSIQGLIRSPIVGPKGNVEFLVGLTTASIPSAEVLVLIDTVMKVD